MVDATALLPALIVLIGGLRYAALDHTIGLIDSYLRTVEAKYKPLGWTTYYRVHNPDHWLRRARYLMWGALFFLAVCFGPIVIHHGPYGEKQTISFDETKKG